jgi:hypothetical protein
MAWASLAGGRILTGKDQKIFKVRKALTEVSNVHNINIGNQQLHGYIN